MGRTLPAQIRVALAATVILAVLFLAYRAAHNTGNLTTDHTTTLPHAELAQHVALEIESQPFFVPARTENGVLYVGYSHRYHAQEPREVPAVYYDTGTREVTAQIGIPDMFFSDICAGDSEVILSSDRADSIAVRVDEGTLGTTSTELSCVTDVPVGPDCASGVTLLRRLLPGSDAELSMCYNQQREQPTFYMIGQDGMVVDLGSAGSSLGGRGRFVVSPGIEPGTYLLHHNTSAIEETAVMIDVATHSVTSASLPDLSDTRTSRGFAAGDFSVTVHPIQGGHLIESAAGQVYLIRNGHTGLLSENVITGSVAVVSSGCTATLLAREESGIVLQEYTLCSP